MQLATAASLRAAHDIAEAYRAGEFNPDESSAARTLINKISDRRYGIERRRNRELKAMPRQILFAFDGCRETPLWVVRVSKQSGAECIYDKCGIGDRATTAMFFAEQYYQYGIFSVRELLPLAAHTILMGHERNALGVDGLEILFSEHGHATLWRTGRPELQELLVNSQALDAEIRRRLSINSTGC